jgi:hypothetical protein
MNDREKWPLPRRLLGFWAFILGLHFLLFSPLIGSGPQYGSSDIDRSAQGTVLGVGALFNLLFTVFFYPRMTRPFIRVFSDRVHEIITAVFIVYNGIFFMFFASPNNIYEWSAYMRNEYPGVVSFLLNIF